MATTTNYGWTTPDNTDLVKDGALAIRTLGSAIDTSMNTALGTKKAGMVLLNTTSFSAVGSQAVSSIFSTTYNNYLIQILVTNATSSGTIQFKLRNATTDKSASYYSTLFRYNYGGTSGINQAVTNGSAITLMEMNATGASDHFSNLNIANPVAVKRKVLFAQSINPDGWGTVMGGFNDDNTYSADGFNIIASAGNITGTICVYGYNK